MRLVADVMSPEPVVVPDGTPLAFCQQLLLEHHIRHLPVVDGDGRLLGVASDVALERERAAGGRTVTSAIDRDVTITRPTETLVHAFSRQLQARHEVSVVVDPSERPMGVLSDHDALELAAVCLPPWTKAGEWATRAVVTADGATDVATTLAWMGERRIRHAPVVEPDGVAMVSFRDLLRVPVGERPSRTVAQVASRPAVVAGERTPLSEVVALLITRRFGAVPLVEGGRVVGILTRTDVVRMLLRVLLHASADGAPVGRRLEPRA